MCVFVEPSFYKERTKTHRASLHVYTFPFFTESYSGENAALKQLDLCLRLLKLLMSANKGPRRKKTQPPSPLPSPPVYQARLFPDKCCFDGGEERRERDREERRGEKKEREREDGRREQRRGERERERGRGREAERERERE